MTVELPYLSLPRDRPGTPNLEVISAQTRSQVFSAILSAGRISRTQIAAQSGLSPSTVTKVVAPLLTANYLVELGAQRPGRGAGRPQRMLAVNGERHVVVGVKLHPTHVTGVLTDMESRVISRASRRLRGRHFKRMLEAAGAVVQELLDDQSGARAAPLGLGVAVGGHVDSPTGTLVHSGVLGWDDVDVATPLAQATGLPTVVNNDLNALVVAERWFGKGRGVGSFAVVSMGAGVGCGLVLRGELYTGSTGLAGELGHLPLQPGGPICSCGNQGCLEAIASNDAILSEVRARGGSDCRSIAQAMRWARSDEGLAGEAAREAYRLAGEALGRGVAALCNLLNLQRIILSGEGVDAYDLLGPALESAWQAHAFSSAARDCELMVDAVDDDLWARGAACLVIHQALHSFDSVTATAPRARVKEEIG
jgi:predicted NBD/HSP70 family sugar kinase